MLSGQLFRSHLRMGSRIRMDHQALHISHIGKKGEYFERIDKLPGCYLSAFNLESENTSGTFREILFIKFMVWMVWKSRMVHFGYFRVFG